MQTPEFSSEEVESIVNDVVNAVTNTLGLSYDATTLDRMIQHSIAGHRALRDAANQLQNVGRWDSYGRPVIP